VLGRHSKLVGDDNPKVIWRI